MDLIAARKVTENVFYFGVVDFGIGMTIFVGSSSYYMLTIGLDFLMYNNDLTGCGTINKACLLVEYEIVTSLNRNSIRHILCIYFTWKQSLSLICQKIKAICTDFPP